MKKNSKFRHIILVQRFSLAYYYAKIKNFSVKTNIFCITKRKVKVERLADSRDAFHNIGKYEGHF